MSFAQGFNMSFGSLDSIGFDSETRKKVGFEGGGGGRSIYIYIYIHTYICLFVCLFDFYCNCLYNVYTYIQS